VGSHAADVVATETKERDEHQFVLITRKGSSGTAPDPNTNINPNPSNQQDLPAPDPPLNPKAFDLTLRVRKRGPGTRTTRFCEINPKTNVYAGGEDEGGATYTSTTSFCVISCRICSPKNCLCGLLPRRFGCKVRGSERRVGGEEEG
jgi:hypothetical protein